MHASLLRRLATEAAQVIGGHCVGTLEGMAYDAWHLGKYGHLPADTAERLGYGPTPKPPSLGCGRVRYYSADDVLPCVLGFAHEGECDFQDPEDEE